MPIYVNCSEYETLFDEKYSTGILFTLVIDIQLADSTGYKGIFKTV